MTELTLYKCNICGKTFEDEAECREHEIEENMETVSSLGLGVVM